MAEFTDGIAVGMAIVRPAGGVIVSKEIVQNGTYYAAADSADGYSPVTVAVPIASKTITKNGVYHAADDDLCGYDPVNVSVPMYWTFQPGETVPDSMIPNSSIEDSAPETPDDVPYPTQQDPQRVVKPYFAYVQTITERPDNDPTVDMKGVIIDAYTGDVLVEGNHRQYTILRSVYPDVTFEMHDWRLDVSRNVLEVDWRFSYFVPPGTYRTEYLGIDCRLLPSDYTASFDSGDNTTTVIRRTTE